MAIPSTTGSEVLRRGGIATQSSSATTFRFDGTSPAAGTTSYTVPTNHIIIMINMILCENAGNAETFKLYRDGNVTIVESQVIGAKETFIYNDKFVLIGGQALYLLCSAGDVDCYYSYIDQNWS